MEKIYEQYLERLPFLTYGRAHGEEYIGIMIVRSKAFTSMYVLNHVEAAELKRELITLGERWWWQSNRNIPISVYLNNELQKFQRCKRTFVTKDFDVIAGPIVSLTKLPTKRIKRCTTILKPRED